jgi:hypothetical protein
LLIIDFTFDNHQIFFFKAFFSSDIMNLHLGWSPDQSGQNQSIMHRFGLIQILPKEKVLFLVLYINKISLSRFIAKIMYLDNNIN